MENKLSNKINIQMFLLIFPILGENILSNLIGSNITKVWIVISCFFIILKCIKNKFIIKPFYVVLILLIIEHVLIFIPPLLEKVILTNANNLIVPYGLIAYFLLFMLINYYIKNGKIISLFKTMYFIMTIFVVLNALITKDLYFHNIVTEYQIAKNTGYTDNVYWLFGHRNMIFVNHILWILFGGLYYKLANKKYTKVFFGEIIFSLSVALYSWNATMLVAIVLLSILYLLRDNLLRELNSIHLIFVYFLFEISVVFFRIQELFYNLIVNVLHRSLSFTGRTEIWDLYINQFFNNSIVNQLLGNLGQNPINVNTHNMLLGLLCYTGIIGTILFVLLLIFSILKLYKNRQSDISKFISIMLFVSLVNSLTMEFYLQPLLIIFIGYRLSEFLNENKSLIGGAYEQNT